MPPTGSRTIRWQHWQDSTAARWFLTETAKAQGYTLLQVPPHARDGFFALVALLQAMPDRLPDDPQARALWQAWLTWSRRLAAYLARLADGKEATCPPLPPVFLELLATASVPEGDPDA